MDIARCTSIVFFAFLSSINAQIFHVVAPNTFRLDTDEQIAIAQEGMWTAKVNVLIQDYPGQARILSETEVDVLSDKPEIFKVRLKPDTFPPNFLSSPNTKKFVVMTVKSDNFYKEIPIAITNKAGYVFVQTDKPIYTPDETVRVRVVSQNEDENMSYEPIKLQIRNPDKSIVEEKIFSDFNSFPELFIGHPYKFPDYPVLGRWSATVLHGYEFQLNTTVHFELREYVLPTFTIDLQTPKVILESHKNITLSVSAKYVFGKAVKGLVTFRVGVKKEATYAILLAVTGPTELREGFAEVTINTEYFANHTDIGCFPGIEGSQLAVEATVLDYATGIRREVKDAAGVFTKSPLAISFNRCHEDFKPGLTSVLEVVVNYFDGTPAEGIAIQIKALVDGKPLIRFQYDAISDEEGKVHCELYPEKYHSTISITVETIDTRYNGSQANGTFVQRRFKSKENAFIALERNRAQKLKIDDDFTQLVHIEPPAMRHIYYAVVSKGKIVRMNKLLEGNFKIQSIDFTLTQEMAPSFRLLVWGHYKDELIADSLYFEFEDSCDPKAEVSLAPESTTGDFGAIRVKRPRSTLVGVFAVDEAVYALSKNELLTKSKVFEAMSEHDLGCGPGGGLTTGDALHRAGVVIATSKYSPKPEPSYCDSFKSKETVADVENTFFWVETERPIEVSGDVGKKKIFDPIAGENEEEPKFISSSEEKHLRHVLKDREDFGESWHFLDEHFRPFRRRINVEFDEVLPSSVTTWVFQVMSLTPTQGLCVAEPQKIVSFKEVFVQLNLPFSVVRNQQVQIPVTVFNYGPKKLGVVVYMYGRKGLCSGIMDGEKSERKRLLIESHSTATVTFLVTPLKIGTFDIKAVALTVDGGDAVIRKLNVVAEGDLVKTSIPIKLDPSNQTHRLKRNITTPTYSDYTDTDKKQQISLVELEIPDDKVSWTGSFSITASADKFESFVEPTLGDLGKLLLNPQEIVQHNTIYLATRLYSLRYLRVTGKTTPEIEESLYALIRQGYVRQLSFRKEDGSYAAYHHRPTSTWLTAFVSKMFCQASELLHIDEEVMCGGVRWLIDNQQPDGSFLEMSPAYSLGMSGRVDDKAFLTAFVLITLEECNCKNPNLDSTKERAVVHLEDHSRDLDDTLFVAVVAYALSLSNSTYEDIASDRLMSMARRNAGNNFVYWETEDQFVDNEATSYGLLNRILQNDTDTMKSIVNWFNTQRLESDSFMPSQDIVIRLQALSEYAIKAPKLSVSLEANLSLNSDRDFSKVLSFRGDDAHVLQVFKMPRDYGTLTIKTSGHGIVILRVNRRYNAISSLKRKCKFDVSVNVSELKAEINEIKRNFLDGHEIYKRHVSPNDGNPLMEVSICARYLRNRMRGMGVIDVEIFPGFVAIEDDIRRLREDPQHGIQRYEISSRGVVFYLKKVPNNTPHCFDFRVSRDYVVGTTKGNLVTVYDSYNPKETCNVFYSLSSSSPMLHMLCDFEHCVCGEVGCPQRNPFKLNGNYSTTERRQLLYKMACETYDYAWKGRVVSDVTQHNGFFNFTFHIDEVLKGGLSAKQTFEGEEVLYFVRDNCSPLVTGETYLMMGKNGDGDTYLHGYRMFFLDQTTAVHLWTQVKTASDKILQCHLNAFVRQLKTKEC